MTATAASSTRGEAETKSPAEFEDWNAADFDSVEVLALLHEPDPVARVTRAREPRRTAGRATEGSAR